MSGTAGLVAALVAGSAVGRLCTVVVGRYVSSGNRRRPLPVTELAMGALWLLMVRRFGAGWAVLPPLVAATSLVTLSAVDLRAYRLPDAIVLPATGASAVAIVTASLALGRNGAMVSAVAVAAGYGAVMWLAHELQPRGLGFGDVKLAPLLGLHIGWVGGAFHRGWADTVGLAAQALLLSCLIGLATGIALAVLRRRGHDVLPDPIRGAAATGGSRLADTSFPFGPPLSAGTLVVVLYSGSLVG